MISPHKTDDEQAINGLLKRDVCRIVCSGTVCRNIPELAAVYQRTQIPQWKRLPTINKLLKLLNRCTWDGDRWYQTRKAQSGLHVECSYG